MGFAALVTAAGTACSGSSAPTDVDLGSGPAVAGQVKDGALDGVTLTFVSWGGAYQDAQKQSVLDPFAKLSGATVLDDGPTEYAKLQAQIANKQVSWDVVDLDGFYTPTRCGTELMKLDWSIIDKSQVPEGMATDCSVPANVFGDVLAFNKDKVGAAPTSWADFFDVAKYPGKRAVSQSTDTGVFEAALLADGVSPDKLYPLDVPRAVRKLNSIRDHLVFYTSGSQAQQMLESGEVDMGIVWTSRARGAAESGAPVAVMWDQAFSTYESLAVPTGVKNPKAAMALINFYLGVDQQNEFAAMNGSGPVNTEATPAYKGDAGSFQITNPAYADKVVKIDMNYWGQNYKMLDDSYNGWVSGA